MRYSVLFTDMDGTLLDNSQNISARNKAAIQAAFSAGKQIVICSGRSWKSLAFFEEELDLRRPNRYGVGFNGGMAYEIMNHRVLFQQPLSKALGVSLAEALTEWDADMMIYTGDKLLAQRETPQTVSYGHHTGLEVGYIGNDFSGVTGPVHKIILHDTPEKLERIKEAILPRFGGHCNIFYSSASLLEFAHPGTHKGTGLRFLSEYLRVPLEEVIAMGDQENDIEMLRAAGLGIAVGNASDTAKAAADVVLAETNDEDAVAKAIYTYMAE
jgi:Cof subfamily protein (haloacid dehalogenase superfamily)